LRLYKWDFSNGWTQFLLAVKSLVSLRDLGRHAFLPQASHGCTEGGAGGRRRGATKELEVNEQVEQDRTAQKAVNMPPFVI
jgi:hypothetical protein